MTMSCCIPIVPSGTKYRQVPICARARGGAVLACFSGAWGHCAQVPIVEDGGFGTWGTLACWLTAAPASPAGRFRLHSASTVWASRGWQYGKRENRKCFIPILPMHIPWRIFLALIIYAVYPVLDAESSVSKSWPRSASLVGTHSLLHGWLHQVGRPRCLPDSHAQADQTQTADTCQPARHFFNKILPSPVNLDRDTLSRSPSCLHLLLLLRQHPPRPCALPGPARRPIVRCSASEPRRQIVGP